MSTATGSAVAAPPRRSFTETERNWLWSVAILVGGIALFAGLKVFEKDLGLYRDGGARVFRSPAEAFMRFTGIAHFLIAFGFMATSRSMRAPGSWGRFGRLLVLGAVLCVGYAWLGAASALAASTLFFGYFLAHDARDQAYFYFANGDGGEDVDAAALSRTLVCFPFLIVSLLTAVTGAVVLLDLPGLEKFTATTMGKLPAGWAWLLVAVPLAATAGLGGAMHLVARRARLGGLWTRCRRYRAVHLVLTGTLLAFLAAALLGFGLYAIVILHVASWYVFTMRQLRLRPPPATPFTLRWFRGTRPGFATLHIGLVVLLLIAGVSWSWSGAGESVLPAWLLLDKDNFGYWTILHVTTSFRPR